MVGGIWQHWSLATRKENWYQHQYGITAIPTPVAASIKYNGMGTTIIGLHSQLHLSSKKEGEYLDMYKP